MYDTPTSDQSAQNQHGVGGAPAVEDWCQFLLATQAIGWFEEPVTLSSGQQSSWYVNWRSVADDVWRLEQAVDMLLATTQAHGLAPDCWFGVPEGATRLALLAQFKWSKGGFRGTYEEGSHRFSMGRAKPKLHGAPKDKHFLGFPTGDVVVVEDVTTTGGSLIKSIEQLQAQNINVIAAITMTDRSTVGAVANTPPREYLLRECGVPLYAMTDARTLLPSALRAQPPSDKIQQRLREEIPELEQLMQKELS